MRFSIIIGAYNQEKYLPTLVDAYYYQTFKDFEVHYCDASSKRNNWIKENTSWHYHHSKEANLGKNLNQGIFKAKGDYCVFIMGDSYPHPKFLEIVNEYVNENACVCGSRMQIDDNMVVQADFRLLNGSIPPDPAILPKEPYNLITGNGLVVPTKALKEIGGWPELKGYGGDDNILAAKLYKRGYVFFSVPQAIIYHFYHKEHFSDEKRQKFVKKTIKKILSGN